MRLNLRVSPSHAHCRPTGRRMLSIFGSLRSHLFPAGELFSLALRARLGGSRSEITVKIRCSKSVRHNNFIVRTLIHGPRAGIAHIRSTCDPAVCLAITRGIARVSKIVAFEASALDSTSGLRISRCLTEEHVQTSYTGPLRGLQYSVE